MIKKEYQKPAMTMVKIQQTQMLCALSQVTSTGLGSDNLNFEGGSGDMEDDAMVKGSGDWSDIW